MKNASIEHLLDSTLNKFFINISPDFEFRPKNFTDSSKIEALVKHGEEKAREALKCVELK